MAEWQDSRPITQVVSGLISDVTGLFHKEIELAKAEASEKFSRVVTGIEVLIFGAVLAIGAVGVAVFLILRGLKGLRASNFKLDRTVASVERDAEIVKERL